MAGYSGDIPEGVSVFEAQFGLAPLGEDEGERLLRVEHLLGIFITAATDPGSRLAHVSTGALMPMNVDIPVPKASVVEAALDTYRYPAELAARRAADAYMAQYEND